MSKFISEAEIEEVRKIRQAEWDKVRTPDQPLEAPEEEYDPRSLYERLQEQKNKKDLEYEESHKLKNLIKGLDSEEVDFLSLVDKKRLDIEREQQLQERKELNEYREKVANLQEKILDEKLQLEISTPKPKAISSSIKSQKKSLLGAIVVKRKMKDDSEAKDDHQSKKNSRTTENLIAEQRQASDSIEVKKTEKEMAQQSTVTGGLQVIGLYQGLYNEHSSDSDSSFSGEEDTVKRDLCGRKIIRKDCEK